MVRTALIVAFSIFCVATLTLAQNSALPDSAELNGLRQRADQGDVKAQLELGYTYQHGPEGVPIDYAEALRWYRKAAEQGDSEARLQLGQMYLDGEGAKRDYAEAARWYGCPKLDEKILSGCRQTSFDVFPQEARDLLTNEMKCDAEAVYDYGSTVNLNTNGTPAYQVCCHDYHRSPCDAVLIGEVGGKWEDLTAKDGLSGFGHACRDFFPLETQHSGFHDVCLPDQCAPGTGTEGKACVSMIWQFGNGRYHPAASVVTKPPQ